MFCATCGSSLPDGSKFCENCGSSTNATAPTARAVTTPNIGTRTGKLILKGDTSPAKAFTRYLPLTLILGILGLLLIIVGAVIDTSPNLGGYLRHGSSYGQTEAVIQTILLIFGPAMLGLAIIFPFLGVYMAKKCFIDVYDDRVCGTYKQVEGQVTTLVPFELTYDSISSVSAIKTKVFIQTTGRTLQSTAFNADDIAKAISFHLSNYQNLERKTY